MLSYISPIFWIVRKRASCTPAVTMMLPAANALPQALFKVVRQRLAQRPDTGHVHVMGLARFHGFRGARDDAFVKRADYRVRAEVEVMLPRVCAGSGVFNARLA